MVLHFKGNLQRGDILVPRAIQDIHLRVQSYSLCGSADHRINWRVLKKQRKGLYYVFARKVIHGEPIKQLDFQDMFDTLLVVRLSGVAKRLIWKISVK